MHARVQAEKTSRPGSSGRDSGSAGVSFCLALSLQFVPKKPTRLITVSRLQGPLSEAIEYFKSTHARTTYRTVRGPPEAARYLRLRLPQMPSMAAPWSPRSPGSRVRPNLHAYSAPRPGYEWERRPCVLTYRTSERPASCVGRGWRITPNWHLTSSILRAIDLGPATDQRLSEQTRTAFRSDHTMRKKTGHNNVPDRKDRLRPQPRGKGSTFLARGSHPWSRWRCSIRSSALLNSPIRRVCSSRARSW